MVYVDKEDMDKIAILTSLKVLRDECPEELDFLLESGIPIMEQIYEIPKGSIVFPRLRVLPWGDLLEKEILFNKSQTINTFHEHRNIANSKTWAHLLDGSDGAAPLSAKQYGLSDMPYLPDGEYFIKGETNSLKHQWSQACYAPTKGDLSNIVNNFMNDAGVGHQAVIIKPFQKYRKLAESIHGQPVFHERRVFILDGKVMSEAFYWSNFTYELGEIEYNRDLYSKALQDAIERTKHLARYYVIDMAEYEDGSWGVVELNDGNMSGLSDNDPATLWNNIQKALISA